MNNTYLLLLLVLLAMAQGQQMRFRLPPGYNMRLGAVPSRFVGTGAYTLSGKRAAANNNWQQKLQLKQQQQQQLQLQHSKQQKQPQPQPKQQQHARMEFFQWATKAGKK